MFRSTFAIVLFLTIMGATATAQDSRKLKLASPKVGAFYFYWYKNPDEHMKNPDGSDALFQHFVEPKKVDYRSPEWHRNELDRMSEASIDICLPVYWGIPDRPAEKTRSVAFADPGLDALVRAWDLCVAGGGEPPKIAMFYDTSTLLRDTRGEEGGGTIDLTKPEGEAIFRKTIARFFGKVPERMRFLMDDYLLVVLYTSFGAPHDAGLLERTSDSLQKELGHPLYFVADESWRARSHARYRWGAALSGPTGDSVVKVVGPGYNDTPVPGRATPIRSREEGRYYLWSWNQALIDRPTLVFIETWNEFHEGTGIAPSKEFGDTYLEITRRSAIRLKNGLLPDLANPVRLAYPEPLSRKDEGWFTPMPTDTEAFFAPGLAEGDRGKGVRLGRAEDGVTVTEYLADRTVVTSKASTALVRYVYFGIADEYAHAVGRSYAVDLEFIDGGTGKVALDYDSWDTSAAIKGAYKSTPAYQRSGAPKIKKVTFLLPDPRFANRENNGCDFRISVTGGDLSITRIAVRPLPERHPGDAEVRGC